MKWTVIDTALLCAGIIGLELISNIIYIMILKGEAKYF